MASISLEKIPEELWRGQYLGLVLMENKGGPTRFGNGSIFIANEDGCASSVPLGNFAWTATPSMSQAKPDLAAEERRITREAMIFEAAKLKREDQRLKAEALELEKSRAKDKAAADARRTLVMERALTDELVRLRALKKLVQSSMDPKEFAQLSIRAKIEAGQFDKYNPGCDPSDVIATMPHIRRE